MQNGKGSKRRPCFVSDKEFEKQWELIFDKKEKENDKSEKSQTGERNETSS